MSTVQAVLVAMFLVGAAGPAMAVHDDGLFQLDYVISPTAEGRANVSSTVVSPLGNTGDDWDKVYDQTSGAFATAFIEDTVGTAETSFFTGGGSKDEEPINAGQTHWLWDSTQDQIPDKDDISNAFAAAYEDPDTEHTIIYFGADRFDTSGDAEVGFWFFREPVTLGTEPNFNGEHELGDVLVVANWGGSNKVGDIAVYEWIGGKNPLALVEDRAQADCSVAPADDPFCAVVNNLGGETPPWSYTNKDGQHSYQEMALFEGGIDFTELFGEDLGCFSSFMAETRSSHSTDAQLKDFALGAFPICGINVTKTGDTLSKVGDPVNYTVTIENTGRATLYKRNISDSLLEAITTNGVDQANPYVQTNNCGASLAPDATCTITLTRTVQAGDPDPLPNTVNILYSENADFTGLEFPDSDDHEVNLFQPAVMIEKTGDELSKVTDTVTYTFTITNMSSEDSPDLELATISDNVIGNLKATADASGCDALTDDEVCSFTVTRTVAAGDPDPLVNTVDVLYHPKGFPNDVTASDGHSVNLFQPSVSIEKTGDGLSKIGDDVTYHVKITNTSSADSPNLVLDSIADDVLGDLADEAPAACDSLAPLASCEFDVPWTVAAVDVKPADGTTDDPIINTVIVHLHPDGFTNDITATASHELNLFQPSITFEKTADTNLSKVGDPVNYTLTLNNTSSPDTPDMSCKISDLTLSVDKTVTLASGEGDVTNVAYTVQAGDEDPLVNTASVHCTFQDFPNELTASDSWQVNLFQPSVDVEKSGPPLSKIGDPVTYTFTITNTSSNDSPDLKLDSVLDDVLGSLTAPSECDNMAPGESCTFSVPWTVEEVDIDGTLGPDDPIVNTVTVRYHPIGFDNRITDSDSHSLNLFQPSISFDKSADTELSKVGDDVNYTLTLDNTSSADTPDMNCVISDVLLGLDKTLTLATGETDVTHVAYTVKAEDQDPLVNTASVMCTFDEFPNVLRASDSWTVNLFQPGISVTKTGPGFTKGGDTASYVVTIENTGSTDAPDLEISKISDSLVGDLKDAGNLAVTGSTCDDIGYMFPSGASCAITYDYVVPMDQGLTLSNTVKVESNPVGFPNPINGEGTWESTVLHPGFTVTKDCKAGTEPVPQEGPATFTVTFTNTGDADLVVAAGDGIGAFGLAVGEKKSFDVIEAGPFTGKATVSNTVTGTITLAERYGLPNEYTFEATGDCRVGGRVNVKKLTQHAVDPTQSWSFALFGDGPHADDTTSAFLGSTPLATGNTLNDADGVLEFGNINLDPTKTYTLCELNVPAGWTVIWKVDTDGDGIADTIVNPFNPNSKDTPPQSLGNQCFDFGAGTSYPVPAGGTLVFEVDNTFPGGQPRTPGYWKNWNYCTGGNQTQTAEKNGGADEGFFTLDDLLFDPGFTIGDMILNGVWDDDAYKYDSAKHNDCVEAVRILNKSDAATGKKMASDAAYELATALLAAELNQAAGAESCVIGGKTEPENTIMEAQQLLGDIDFTGTGSYLPSKGGGQTLRAKALSLATTLDLYNNGDLCV